MVDVLKHGVEKLSEALRTNPDTEDTFESMAKVFEEISKYIEEQNRGPVDNFIRMSPCFGSFLVECNDWLQVMWLQRAINLSLKNCARR